MTAAPSPVALKKLRAICLSLPNTKETLSWGSPHFRVGEKIFCGIGGEKGVVAIGFKLEMDHADAIIQDPRFWRAPYVGKYGWVSMGVTPKMNWRQVKALVEESYRLIAPKRKAGIGKPKPETKRTPRKRA
jgi:predicted DNA-binding protein (MmcQ/YjbR family)